MEWQGSLIPLFWLFLLIFIIQALLLKFRWIKVPSILAYILLGVFLSNMKFEGFQGAESDWLNGLSQLGLFYLMFLSGMEIDLKLLRFKMDSNLKQNPLVIGFVVFLGSALLAFIIGMRIHHIDPSVQSWMMMLILLTTSLGIVMPVLKENRIIQSRYGQILLTSAILADLITMVILSVVAGSYPSGISLRQASVGLLIPLLVVCYFIFSRLKGTPFWGGPFQKNTVVKLQGALAVLGLYGVITDLTGSEPILGSFLAGMLLSGFQMDEHHPFKQQLEVIGYGFIIPIFFVMVGYGFKVSEFLMSSKALAWVPLLLSTAYVVKLLPMTCFGPILGWRKALQGGSCCRQG